jgi:nucleoside-diphosphate-sugar epimerase
VATAFVTGGSGFVGGELIRRLTAGGYEVRALARSEASAAKVAELGADPVRGDLGDRDQIRSGAEGCEFAFHAAAKVDDWGPIEDFERVNVEGTRSTLEGCRAAGVRRFVHVGTEAAILAGQPVVGGDETLPLRPDSPAPYSATKAMAEQVVRDASGEGFDAVVVRPRFVWGRGDTTLLPQLCSAAESGKLAWIGGGRHKTSTTHVENTVAGLIAGAENGAPGEAYFVTDGPDSEFRGFVTRLIETQGVEVPQRNVPRFLARALMGGGEAASRLTRKPPPLTRFAFWVASEECTLDDSKARRDLGYEPVKSIDDGMAELRTAA